METYFNCDIIYNRSPHSSKLRRIMKKEFMNCFDQINQLIENPEIEIKAVDYKLIFYLCSDYKIYAK